MGRGRRKEETRRGVGSRLYRRRRKGGGKGGGKGGEEKSRGGERERSTG